MRVVCRLAVLALCAGLLAPWPAGAVGGVESDAASADLSVTAAGRTRTHTYPTLAEAVQAARMARSGQASARIEIRVGPGVVRLSRPLELGPDLSGTPAAPTVIAAKPGARPELRASRRVSLDWRPFRDGIWVADVAGEDFDQIWVNDQRQVLARYPNFDPSISPLNGYASDALSVERAARWSHPEDGVVRAIHRSRWGGVVFRIVGRGPVGAPLLDAPVANNRVRPPMNEPHERYRFVEGLFEDLDAAGEWFFDRRERRLYYKPSPGVDLAKAKVEVSASVSILRLVGSRAAPVHDVVIEGLSFARSKDTLLHATEPLLRSDWKIAREGAVFLTGTERVALRDGDFHDLGGQAVFVSGYNREVAIERNAFWDIGGTAISFVGLPSAVRSPSFEYEESVPLDRLDRTPGPQGDDYPAASRASDNLIHDVGRSDKQAAGIEIATAMDIAVAYNSIYHVPRAGINIGDGTWGGHVLEHNDVFDTVLETGDHGAFNAWGRDRYWQADREAMNAAAAREPSLPFLDVIKPIILRNNRFQSDHGWDVDLDDGASNYQIYNNVMLTGGLKLREGFRRIVFNNVIVNNSLHPHVWFKDSGDSFQRNIVMGPYQPILMGHWTKAVDGNLFPDQAALSEAHRLGLDANSNAGDPQFVDSARGDYRVSATSPALALGFKNFPMTFGVRSPRLRALARQPEVPALIRDTAGRKAVTAEVLGAMVKSIETLGEQSAAGLPEIRGVLVLAVKPGTPASEAGLAVGDVILKMVNRAGEVRLGDDLTIGDLPALLSTIQARKWQGTLRFEIQRNQTPRQIDLKI